MVFLAGCGFTVAPAGGGVDDAGGVPASGSSSPAASTSASTPASAVASGAASSGAATRTSHGTSLPPSSAVPAPSSGLAASSPATSSSGAGASGASASLTASSAGPAASSTTARSAAASGGYAPDLGPASARNASGAIYTSRRGFLATAPRVPSIAELGMGSYFGFQGGLYPGGQNSAPATHHAAGVAAANAVQPINGKVMLLSIGFSNTTMEFCIPHSTTDGDRTSTPLQNINGVMDVRAWGWQCRGTSFMGQAWNNRQALNPQLVIVNGAASAQTMSAWSDPVTTGVNNYDRVRDSVLTPLGHVESEVQAVWLKVANPASGTRALGDPVSSAPLYLDRLRQDTGNVLRAIRRRYVNVKQVFLSGRIYGGYAVTQLNAEPFAYESGFAVKWIIESQVSASSTNPEGNVANAVGGAPWTAWGPNLWHHADLPPTPPDEPAWLESDVDPGDGTHPNHGARQKVGAPLLGFFTTSPYTRCWFVAGAGPCQ